MSHATKPMRHFAKRLIVFENKGKKLSTTETPAAFHVPDKLRLQLAILMGTSGFRALLLRAFALAAAEVNWLRAVQVKADGSMEGLEEFRARLKPDEFLEGQVVLLAQLLGLMVAFVGENLTLRLISEVWPKIPLNDLDFENRGEK